MRADRGFHVIKLISRKVGDAKPLSAMQDDIRIQLRQKEMEKQTKSYLAELRKPRPVVLPAASKPLADMDRREYEKHQSATMKALRGRKQ